MSKRKANNPLKRAHLVGRKVLKDKAVVFVKGLTEAATLLDLKTLETRMATPTEATFIANYAWKWAFELSAVCRSQIGREYVSSEALECQSPYKQGTPELIDLLNSEHSKFANGCNTQHIITLGWVARPVPAEDDPVLTPERLAKVYEKLGAFEFLAQWEAKKQEEVA